MWDIEPFGKIFIGWTGNVEEGKRERGAADEYSRQEMGIVIDGWEWEIFNK